MIVLVTEVGPDGVANIKWDTEKLKAVDIHDNGDAYIDVRLFANYLETGSLPESFHDCDFTWSYSLMGLEHCEAPDIAMPEKCITLYCE